MNPLVLQALDLQAGYRRGRPVLQGVSLSLAAGELVALLGGNGAGKSTLMRLLMGLALPWRGEVRLRGRLLASLPRRTVAAHLAYVPQTHHCPFPYSVREMVLLGRLGQGGWLRGPSAADHAAADQALQRLGLTPLAGRPCTQLSGGEQQLMLIARALAQGAQTLILDEPASGLDMGHQQRLLGLLRGLAAEGCSVLMSTHQPAQALTHADRVLVLDQGRLLADGVPARVLTPALLQTLYGLRAELLFDAQGHAAGFAWA
jgi:iron complex transport system ATP-binding protein